MKSQIKNVLANFAVCVFVGGESTAFLLPDQQKSEPRFGKYI